MLIEECLSVLLMRDVLLHGSLFYAFLRLWPSLCCPTGLEDAVQLGTQANILCNCPPSALIFQLPQNLLIGCTVQRVILGVVRRIVDTLVLGHVTVHILSLDLKENAVGVRVPELPVANVLPPELVVVEVVHQVSVEIKIAHSSEDRTV